ncbi:hypothetical protein AB0H92_12085 [Streptomyces phaeochromogenes]|uniref:hypothetical protein n=1 Tax=Streptomyces phaeochromogenes TaxID=1923 RepID=UPI0033E1B10C
MRQPDADTNGKDLRPVLAPVWGLPSERVRDLAPGLREEPRRRTAGGIRRQADTDGAPGGERAGRRGRRGRNVDTRLEVRDWDIGVFLTDLPSWAEHNPVRTETDPEHRVALSHACARLPASAAPGAAGGGRRRQVVTAESLDVRNQPSSYRSASNGGDSALPEWREVVAGNLTGPVAAWRVHRAGGRESTGGV